MRSGGVQRPNCSAYGGAVGPEVPGPRRTFPEGNLAVRRWGKQKHTRFTLPSILLELQQVFVFGGVEVSTGLLVPPEKRGSHVVGSMEKLFVSKSSEGLRCHQRPAMHSAQQSATIPNQRVQLAHMRSGHGSLCSYCLTSFLSYERSHLHPHSSSAD